MSEVYQTPVERFENLPGYSFSPQYVKLESHGQPALNMHYVDEGDKGARFNLLLLHGEPSWSYLYRKMIPKFVEAGYRVVAPDLVGFGRSDKPLSSELHTYTQHEKWLEEFVEKLNLKNIVSYVQDWGGLLGLRHLANHNERYAGAVIANTGLPSGEFDMPDEWYQFHDFVAKVSKLPIGKLIANGLARPIDKAVRQAYDAPFPEEKSKLAPRLMPQLVPRDPEDPECKKNQQIWEKLKQIDTPILTGFSTEDPITRGGDVLIRRRMRGAKGQPHKRIENAGHFLQEDAGEEIADYLNSWLSSSTYR